MYKLSIMIPTYKRTSSLKSCLDSIILCGKRRDFEIFIVIDGHDKKIYSLIRRYSRRHPIRHFIQNHSGPAAARNLGLRKARGEIIAFLDDDCVVGKDWIKRIIAAHRKYPQAIAGSIVPVKKNLISEFSQGLEARASLRDGEIFYPSLVNNNSYRKSQLKGIKFNESFKLASGEDVDFNMKLHKRGIKTRFVKDIVVYHSYKTSLFPFLGQQFRFGKSRPMLMRLSNDYPFRKKPFLIYTVKRLATPFLDPWLRLWYAMLHRKRGWLLYLPLGYLQQAAYWCGFAAGLFRYAF